MKAAELTELFWYSSASHDMHYDCLERPRASSHVFRALPLGVTSRSIGADELYARAGNVIGQIAHGTTLCSVETESVFILSRTKGREVCWVQQPS